MDDPHDNPAIIVEEDQQDDEIEGQEEYDFTNANLAGGLDPSIPLSYLMFKLAKAAPQHWRNADTASCVLSPSRFLPASL